MADTFKFTIEQKQDYEFTVRFGESMGDLLVDEPPPLGHAAGPNPSRLLATGVANCLMASLLFAMRKFKNDPGKLSATVTGHYARNEANRLRIGEVQVEIAMEADAGGLEHMDRIVAQFEDYCVVTQSVRSGFPVRVTVRDGTGKVLKDGSE